LTRQTNFIAHDPDRLNAYQLIEITFANIELKKNIEKKGGIVAI
jgi:hypothetical protein